MRSLWRHVVIIVVFILVGAMAGPTWRQITKAYAQEREGREEVRDEARRERGEGEERERDIGEGEERGERDRPEREEGEREREREFVSEDAYHLWREADRLAEQGRREAAQELRAKAERIEAEARERRERERDEREGRERPEFTSDEAYRMWREADRLAEQGRREAAQELRAKAERIEVESRERREREPAEREERERPEFVSEEAYGLWRNAEIAAEEGRPDLADQLRARAMRVERAARARRDRDMPRAREEAARPREIVAQIEELRAEIGQLREELAELKNLLRELLERR